MDEMNARSTAFFRLMRVIWMMRWIVDFS